MCAAAPPPPTSTCLWDIRGHTIWTKDHLKTETPNGKPRGPSSQPSSAHAHSCGHMASARVRHPWEPAGAPSPPSPSESGPSKLKQHSVTNRNANRGGLGLWDSGLYFSVFSACQFGGGSNVVLLYSHTHTTHEIKIKLYFVTKTKKKKKRHHNGHRSFFDSCTNELVLLQLLESLKGMVHTANNKQPYLEKSWTFPVADQVHQPIDVSPPSSENGANVTSHTDKILVLLQVSVLLKTKHIGWY